MLKQALDLRGSVSMMRLPFADTFAELVAVLISSDQPAASDSARNLVPLLLGALPETLPFLGGIDDELLGKSARLFNELVPHFLKANIPPSILPRSRQRMLALRSILARLSAQGSMSVPFDWVFQVTLQIRSPDRHVAELSTWILGEWVRRLQVTAGARQYIRVKRRRELAMLQTALTTATLDERPGVRASGIRALVELGRLNYAAPLNEQPPPIREDDAVCLSLAASGIAYPGL